MEEKPVGISVGIIFVKDDKILLVDRKFPPLGWACSAGHVDPGETPLDAAVREAREETGFDLESWTVLVDKEMVAWNNCYKHNGHVWTVVHADRWSGEYVHNSQEHGEMGWFLPEEVRQRPLERVWSYWLEKFHYI